MVLLIAVTLNAYMLFYVVPTDDVALGGSFANMSEDTGVNRFEVDGSVLTGYVHYLGQLVQGDLGQSWRTREDVTEIIGRAAPATASLVLGGAVLWIGLALVIGVVSAMRPRTPVRPCRHGVRADRDRGAAALARVRARLSLRLPAEWFPIAGYCDVIHPQNGVSCGGPVQWAYHLFLPWLTFALAFAAMYARMIRANLLETKNEDYVRTARAKGLSEWATVRRHTFRNAVLPIMAMVGMDVGLAFAGALFVERAFRIPGIGMLTISSLQRRDLPVDSRHRRDRLLVVVDLQPDRRPRPRRPRSAGRRAHVPLAAGGAGADRACEGGGSAGRDRAARLSRLRGRRGGRGSAAPGTWSIASTTIELSIFDSPTRRSTKVIGISTTVNPARRAR